LKSDTQITVLLPKAAGGAGTQGELMVVLPVSSAPRNAQSDPDAPQGVNQASDDSSLNWLRASSALTLVASGALLLSGKNRLGLVAAATGTSLAMIDQQDTLTKWWAMLPGYIAQVQGILEQVESAVDQFGQQREKLGQILGR
jgi:hypothetical protein